MQINIRKETPADHRVVENLTREAFWNVHVPGCDEHYLVTILRDADAFVPALDFVAEVDGEIVGNIMYTKAWIVGDDSRRHDVILFGPLSVLPAWQRKGVGSALVRHSADVARALGHRAILIYGDPDYYSRLGFLPASDFGITPPDGMPHPALQVLPLVPGALDGLSGRFHEDALYETIRPEDVEAFDRQFPPKKRERTQSQLRFAQLSGQGDVSPSDPEGK